VRFARAIVVIDILFIWHDQQSFARASNICKANNNNKLKRNKLWSGNKRNILRSYELEPMFVLLATLPDAKGCPCFLLSLFDFFFEGVDGRLFAIIS